MGGTCLEMGFAILYLGFLEIPHDGAQTENLDVFIVPLSTNMYCKTNARPQI